ncbi:MAG TPA: hypothetical protein VK622_03475, partial [Puia sp.]|nr:hypothetical protein [Puia sp.]
MRNFLICFTFLVWKNFLPAQVGFSRVPSHLQMFPRDSTNYGHFYVEGQCAQPGVLRTVLSEMGSDSIIETFSLQANTNEYFSLHHKIPACLK